MTVRPNIASKVRGEGMLLQSDVCICFDKFHLQKSVQCEHHSNPTGMADFTLSGDKETSRIARGESMSMRIPLRNISSVLLFYPVELFPWTDRPDRIRDESRSTQSGSERTGRFEDSAHYRCANVVNTKATAVFFSSKPLSFLFKS